MALTVAAILYVAASITAGFLAGIHWISEESEAAVSRDDPNASPAGSPMVELKPASASLVTQPLAFVVNDGRSDPRVFYTAFGPGFALGLTSNGILLSLSKDRLIVGGGTRIRAESELASPTASSTVLELEFVGANAGVVPYATERMPGVFNFVSGTDPARWRTNVPAYAKVVYDDLWPGVDLVLSSDRGRLAYRLVASTHAQMDQVRFAYRGAQAAAIDPKSDLAAAGTEPLPARLLVADHGLIFSTFLGGGCNDSGGADYGRDLKADESGNAYLVGETRSPYFPADAGGL
jgi:hypothetical protein